MSGKEAVPQITGGRVVYSRTIQPAQYESKRFEAELTFVVPEGCDYQKIFDVATAQAHGKVHEVLGLAPVYTPASPLPAGTKSDKDKLADKIVGEVAASEPAKKPPTPRKRKAAEIEPIFEGDPAAMGEPSAASAETSAAAISPASSNPASMGDEDPLSAGAPAEITDKELSEAASKKNAEIKDATRIRKLVASYGVAHAHAIPQDRRGAFLLELKALKPVQAAA